MRLILLHLIEGEPRHGYDLIRAIEEMTGGGYSPSPGVIYPTLTMLAEMELIREDESEGTRRRFAITEAGVAHLAENAEIVSTLIARLTEMREARARPDVRAVRRSMHNLRAVLADRFEDSEPDPVLIDQAVALIDEVARKIERL